MANGVPLLAIIRRDVAPSLAKLLYPEDSSADVRSRERLMADAFGQPASESLKMALTKAEDLRIAGTPVETQQEGRRLLSFVKSGFESNPLPKVRTQVPQSVYERLARYEFERLVTKALVPFVVLTNPELGLHVSVLDTTGGKMHTQN